VNVKHFLPCFGEVREEVENGLCYPHVLAAVVLWEEGLSTNQGQPKDVRDILPAHAAKSLNHKQSVINSAKPNTPKGRGGGDYGELLGTSHRMEMEMGCNWNGLDRNLVHMENSF
jgi:hypothetical protein